MTKRVNRLNMQKQMMKMKDFNVFYKPSNEMVLCCGKTVPSGISIVKIVI